MKCRIKMKLFIRKAHTPPLDSGPVSRGTGHALAGIAYGLGGAT